MKSLIRIAALAVILAFTLPGPAPQASCDFCYEGWTYNGRIEGGPCGGIGDRWYCATTDTIIWICNPGGGGGDIIMESEGPCWNISEGGSGQKTRIIRPGDEGYDELRKDLKKARKRAKRAARDS
jgi:hypothetical protein